MIANTIEKYNRHTHYTCASSSSLGEAALELAGSNPPKREPKTKSLDTKIQNKANQSPTPNITSFSSHPSDDRHVDDILHAFTHFITINSTNIIR